FYLSTLAPPPPIYTLSLHDALPISAAPTCCTSPRSPDAPPQRAAWPAWRFPNKHYPDRHIARPPPRRRAFSFVRQVLARASEPWSGAQAPFNSYRRLPIIQN